MKEYLVYIHRKAKNFQMDYTFAGLAVIEASHGEQALTLANQHAAHMTSIDKHFDFIVVDLKAL